MRVSENPLHPDMLRLDAESITVTALDATLAGHPKRGFICTVEAGDVISAKRLTGRGFTPIRHTFEGHWMGDSTAIISDFEHGTLASRPDLTPQWLAAHRQHYAATHRANPPAAGYCDGVFLGEDFRPEAAFYILENGKLIAFSSLRPSSEGWEQAWFGTNSKHPRNFAALNKGLVALETEFMSQESIEAVLVEWDSTSTDATWRLEQYSLEQKREYITFAKT